jgi:hypothetical protein
MEEKQFKSLRFLTTGITLNEIPRCYGDSLWNDRKSSNHFAFRS